MYFEFYEDRFRPMFDEGEWPTLADLTCRSVEVEAGLMEVETPIVRASELDGAPDSVDAILAAMDTGDESLLCLPDTADVDAKTGRDVQVLQFELEPYRQNFEGFEPEMSAMDFAFNYGPDAAVRIADAARVHPYSEAAKD